MAGIGKLTDVQAKKVWDVYFKNFLSSVSAELNESEPEKRKRVQRLQSNFEEWKVYYFPKYCSAPSPDFHKRSSARVLNNAEWIEGRVWARELAKDVLTMMETLYQTLTGIKRNVLFISNSWDKAAELLEPFRINLTFNERIISDYGIQEMPGQWTYGDFTTVAGASFLAIGAGQSPRGSRNENVRPDKIIISDIDTDEDVRNKDIIDKRWQWYEKAVYPTRSVSMPFQVIWLGNLIAKDCCVARACEKADKVDIVNLEDKNGSSTWPEKNTHENIERIKRSISSAAYQAEYMNNPLTEGSVFKEMRWGKVPPLNKFKFIVAYGDPAPSNKVSKTPQRRNKALFLIGILDGVCYVITGYLDSVSNAEYVSWYYNLKDYVDNRTQVYNAIENNSLQDPFYQQVFLPLFVDASKYKGFTIPIIPDERKKPDKFSRIEGNLDPLNRSGNLILNEAEKGNPHMLRLEEQFKLVAPGLPSAADGPDAIEGGWFFANEKLASYAAGSLILGEHQSHSKRI